MGEEEGEELGKERRKKEKRRRKERRGRKVREGRREEKDRKRKRKEKKKRKKRKEERKINKKWLWAEMGLISEWASNKFKSLKPGWVLVRAQ